MIWQPSTASLQATPPRRVDAALLGAFVLLVCLGFTRGVWHGLDGYNFLDRIQNGHLDNSRHPLYLTLAAVLARPLLVLGVPLFEAGAASSAIGVAAGAVAVHRALAGLGLSRSDCLLVTATVASCFGLLYFGTVIEIHGLFFGGAGAAWWAFARLLRRPGRGAQMLLGALSGLATTIHATGHLLPPMFAAFAWAWGGERFGLRRVIPGFAVVAAAHAATVTAVTEVALLLQGQALTSPFGGSAGYVGQALEHGTSWGTAPGIFWREWLRPFLPISLLAFAAFARAPLRFPAAMLAACVAVYLAVTVVLLSPTPTVEQPQYLPPLATIEYGAYFLPLLVPAALLALQLPPLRWRPLVPAVGLAWAVAGLIWSDRQPGDIQYGRDAAAVIERDKVRLFLGGYEELDPLMRVRPVADCHPVYELYIYLTALRGTLPFEYLATWFDVQYAQAEAAGGKLMITPAALELMHATRDGMVDRLGEYIREHYRLVPFRQGRFQAFDLTKNP